MERVEVGRRLATIRRISGPLPPFNMEERLQRIIDCASGNTDQFGRYPEEVEALAAERERVAEADAERAREDKSRRNRKHRGGRTRGETPSGAPEGSEQTGDEPGEAPA